MKNRRKMSNLKIEAKVSVKSIFQTCEKPLTTSLAFSFFKLSSICIFALNTHLLVTILTFSKSTTTSHVLFAIKAFSSA